MAGLQGRLPSQGREQWMSTLRNVLDLMPDHISCYGLKVELLEVQQQSKPLAKVR